MGEADNGTGGPAGRWVSVRLQHRHVRMDDDECARPCARDCGEAGPDEPGPHEVGPHDAGLHDAGPHEAGPQEAGRPEAASREAGVELSMSYPGIVISNYDEGHLVGERWIPLGAEPSEEDDELLIEQLRAAMLWQARRPPCDPAEE